MKIIFITSGVLPVPAVQGGAVETLTDALASQNEIACNDFDFTFLTIESKNIKKQIKKLQQKKNHYQCIKVPKTILAMDKTTFWVMNNFFKLARAKKARFLFQRLFFIYKCHCYLKQNPYYDKIIIQNHPTLLLSVLGTSYCLSNQAYYYAHNEISHTFLHGKLLSQCKGIICVSGFLKNSIRDHFKNYLFKKQELIVIKNVVDTDLFKKFPDNRITKVRARFGYSKDDVVILFTGRLIPEKGIEPLIIAVNKLAMEDPHIKLLIVGATSFALKVKPEFEKKLLKLTQNKPNIKFTGFIPNNQLPQYYNLSDIIALPSIWDEPAGLTMLEAVACKKPLITTTSGGIPEYIPSENAILLNPGQGHLQSDLEHALKSLIYDKNKRNHLVNNLIQNSSLSSYSDYYADFISIFQNQ